MKVWNERGRSVGPDGSTHVAFRVVHVSVVWTVGPSAGASFSQLRRCDKQIPLLDLALNALDSLRRRIHQSRETHIPSNLLVAVANKDPGQARVRHRPKTSRPRKLTAISLSITSTLSCSVLSKARWAVSSFDRFPVLPSGGAVSFTFSKMAVYSSRVEETVWNVAVIFHGFVDM